MYMFKFSFSSKWKYEKRQEKKEPEPRTNEEHFLALFNSWPRAVPGEIYCYKWEMMRDNLECRNCHDRVKFGADGMRVCKLQPKVFEDGGFDKTIIR